MRALRRFALRDGGQSLVEIGIAMPIMAFALIGGVDLLRVAAVQQAVVNAARVGAEFAAADTTQTDAAVTAQVTSELNRTPGLVAANAVITLPTRNAQGAYQGALADGTTVCSSTVAGPPPQPCFIAVSVRYTFRTIVAWPYVPNRALVDRSAAMPMVD